MISITDKNGFRTPIGHLLAQIALEGTAGLQITRDNISALIDVGYITYGLHPLGGWRATITPDGLKILA